MSHRRKPPLAPPVRILFAALANLVTLLLPVGAARQSVLNMLGGFAGLVGIVGFIVAWGRLHRR